MKYTEKLHTTRIDRFIDHIADQILGESVAFDANFAWCEEPVPFRNRLDLDYQPIFEGEIWGQAWESAWFHLKGKVPEEWQGRKVVANLDFSGEGLVADGEGNFLQGITNGSVFKENFARDVVPLLDRCKGGEEIELWVETAANGLFGVFTEPDPAEDSPHRYGHYEANVNKIRLCTFDEELWTLLLDLKVLNGLVKALPEKSVRRSRIIRTLNEAIDAYDETPAGIYKCRGITARELHHPASASDLSATAVGHAHIDTAWLWPVRETIRKCARTFANQIALIEKYPDYIFGASQPQLYAFVKEYYPDLFEKIKTLVAAGRWELQGGMWVEADCNLISGESMIRQILHGKNFFKDEFDIDVDNCWLPDVFGYSAAMPQILRKSGIQFFMTQKLCWNQLNEFPHHSFIWRGIDDSEVLSHFPPENTYNGMLDSDSLIRAQENFKEKDFLEEFLCAFGVGDGGGGPKEENLEQGLRQRNLEGSPKVKFGSAGEFFTRLRRYENLLPVWVGELYLEAHRGTLTSQAKLKKTNRQLEYCLREVEMLWSCLPINQYPSQELDTAWKTILLNQFHDILPGSSITKVCEDTSRELNDTLQTCENLKNEAASRLFQLDPNSLILINTTSYKWQTPVDLPDDWRDFSVTDEQGKELSVQVDDRRSSVLMDISAHGILTLQKVESVTPSPIEASSLILENDQVLYEFNEMGFLTRAFDKQENREILEPGKIGNILTLYDDHPNDWDAWEIDIFYEKHVADRARAESVDFLPRGSVRQGLFFKFAVGQSTIEQTITLAEGSKRLDFETTVDWKEKHKMLRVAFPVDVKSDQASFDIQYGYIRRNTHRNTSWDEAKFEVVGHRYADLTDHDYGVALLNNCKYGYKVHDNVLDLNLLRAPTYPDPDADQRLHEFTYSLLPHSGDLIHSNVLEHATQLNQGLVAFAGYKTDLKQLPWRVEGDGLSLEVVKKAEKEDCLILRVVETLGRQSKGKLLIDHPGATLIETHLMEWEDGDEINCDGSVEIDLKPFEIRTWKLKTH
jgi:alpha-mannosidase